MESTLLLRCEGIMQSWGVSSRFSQRETGMEPSFSGIIGLILCSLGKEESSFPLTDLTALQMAVRVDKEGKILRDYQTALGGKYATYDLETGKKIINDPQGFPLPSGRYRGKGKATITSDRYYLQDASFLVGIYGSKNLLEIIANALSDPVWPLFLGRKCCPPSVPVFIGLVDRPLLDAVKLHPLTDRKAVRLIFESENGVIRYDIPVSFERREFRGRRVSSIMWEAS